MHANPFLKSWAHGIKYHFVSDENGNRGNGGTNNSLEERVKQYVNEHGRKVAATAIG